MNNAQELNLFELVDQFRAHQVQSGSANQLAAPLLPHDSANDPADEAALQVASGPGFTAFWRDYQQAVRDGHRLVQETLDRSVPLFERRRPVGEAFDDAEHMIVKTARHVRAALIELAQKRFAPPSGVLRIGTDDIEADCPDAWGEEGFDPDVIWAALERRYGGQAGVDLAYEQVATQLVSQFGLVRHPPLRRANRLQLEARVYCERRFSGGNRLSYNSEETARKLLAALATFCTWAGDSVSAAALATPGKAWSDACEDLVSRHRVSFGPSVSIVTFLEKLQVDLWGDLGETKFQAFIGRFGAKALAQQR